MCTEIDLFAKTKKKLYKVVLDRNERKKWRKEKVIV